MFTLNLINIMGIIIRYIENEYLLESVSHTPFNLTPFTKPEAIQDFCYYMNVGKIKDLCGLEVDKEYDLDYRKDFDIVERISQVKHSNGLIYDDLTYRLKG